MNRDPDGEVLRLLLGYVDFERALAEHPGIDREAVEEYRRQAASRQRLEGRRGGSMTLWVDGASAGNPGPAGIGIVLADTDGTVLEEIAEGIGRATNNVAEYRALLRGLEEARAYEVADLEIRMDSELVVRQITGVYRVKDPDLRRLHRRALDLLRGFDRWSIQAIRRGENARADELSGEGVRRNATPGAGS